MSRVHVRSSGLEALIDELDEWSHLPTLRQTNALNSALRSAFADTQTRVHVESGALKASGRYSSDTDEEDGSWTGRISYGGPGLEQSVYEVAHGGTHDPFHNMHAFDELFLDAFTQDTP